MAAADLFAELVLGKEVLREPEALVQAQFGLRSFGNRGPVRLHRAMAAGEEGLDVLRGGRRGEGALEDPQRGGAVAGIGGGALEGAPQGARAVEGELGVLGGSRNWSGLLGARVCRIFLSGGGGARWGAPDWLSMAEPHGNQNLRGQKAAGGGSPERSSYDREPRGNNFEDQSKKLGARSTGSEKTSARVG